MAWFHYRTSDRTGVSVGVFGAFMLALLWLCKIIAVTALICLGLVAIACYAAGTVAWARVRGGDWRATWAARRDELDRLSGHAPWRRGPEGPTSE